MRRLTSISLLFLLTLGWSGSVPADMLLRGVGPRPAAGGADYVVAKAFVYIHGQLAGTTLKVGIYNSGGSLLDTSDNCSIPGTGNPQWIECTVTTGPTLTAGGTIYLSVHGNGYTNVRLITPPTFKMRYVAATWDTTPTTITPASDTESSNGEWCVYVTNAASTRLAGQNNTGSCTGNGSPGTGTDNMYMEDGYTVVTL